MTKEQLEQLCKDFEFENRTFVPIFHLAALSIGKTYKEVKEAYQEHIVQDRIVQLNLRFIFNIPFSVNRGTSKTEYQDCSFYIDERCNYFFMLGRREDFPVYLRSNDKTPMTIHNPKDMMQVALCLMHWGFVDDLANKIINAGLIDNM